MYLGKSWSKYKAGRTGVTSTEQAQIMHHPPAVAVCARAGEYGPAEQFQPWISWVRYTQASPNNDDNALV